MKAEGHEVRRKIPVPSNYRNAAKYLRQAIEEKKCIKKDLLNDKHFRAGRTIMHRLMVNQPQINAIIKHIDLKTKEPRMNEWMARVLICELLYGSGNLVGNCLPVETIRRYANEIHAAFEETKADNPPIEHFKEPRFVRINTSTLNLEGAKRMMQEEGWILVDEEFTNYQAFLDRVRALTDLEYMVDFHFNDMLVFPNSAKGYWARAEHLRSKFFLQNKACLVPTYLLNPAKKIRCFGYVRGAGDEGYASGKPNEKQRETVRRRTGCGALQPAVPVCGRLWRNQDHPRRLSEHYRRAGAGRTVHPGRPQLLGIGYVKPAVGTGTGGRGEIVQAGRTAVQAGVARDERVPECATHRVLHVFGARGGK